MIIPRFWIGVRRSLTASGAALIFPWLAAPAQTAGFGEIQGRVFSASSGNYVNNARVGISGSALEALTNSSGEYRLSRVPAGEANLVVTYAGLTAQSVRDIVANGGIVRRDFDLDVARSGAAGG